MVQRKARKRTIFERFHAIESSRGLIGTVEQDGKERRMTQAEIKAFIRSLNSIPASKWKSFGATKKATKRVARRKTGTTKRKGRGWTAKQHAAFKRAQRRGLPVTKAFAAAAKAR